MKPFRAILAREDIFLVILAHEYDWELGKYRFLGFDSDGQVYAVHQDDLTIDVKHFGKEWFK